MIKTTRLRLSAYALCVLAVVPVRAAAQEASTGDGDDFWAVGITVNALRMISPRSGPGRGGVYWYLLYTLKNETGADRDLYVNVTATTDGKKRYADLFLPAVERAAETKEAREFWGKTDQFRILTERDPTDPKYNYFTLKANEEKRCIAVFNRFDPNANQITIHIAGLSGGIQERTRADGIRVLIQRLRELSFERPGDEFAVTLDSFRLKDERWIKREVPLVPAPGSGI